LPSEVSTRISNDENEGEATQKNRVDSLEKIKNRNTIVDAGEGDVDKIEVGGHQQDQGGEGNIYKIEVGDMDKINVWMGDINKTKIGRAMSTKLKWRTLTRSRWRGGYQQDQGKEGDVNKIEVGGHQQDQGGEGISTRPM
jgi:hypothetical protein